MSVWLQKSQFDVKFHLICVCINLTNFKQNTTSESSVAAHDSTVEFTSSSSFRPQPLQHSSQFLQNTSEMQSDIQTSLAQHESETLEIQVRIWNRAFFTDVTVITLSSNMVTDYGDWHGYSGQSCAPCVYALIMRLNHEWRSSWRNHYAQ